MQIRLDSVSENFPFLESDPLPSLESDPLTCEPGLMLSVSCLGSDSTVCCDQTWTLQT